MNLEFGKRNRIYLFHFDNYILFPRRMIIMKMKNWRNIKMLKPKRNY